MNPWSAVHGTLTLDHRFSALGQTGQVRMEKELIEEAMTHLTEWKDLA